MFDVYSVYDDTMCESSQCRLSDAAGLDWELGKRRHAVIPVFSGLITTQTPKQTPVSLYPPVTAHKLEWSVAVLFFCFF